MAHSKRNTSLAFFTAHERASLKGIWGSRSTRLSRDAFLPFGHCRLCLGPARSPIVACASQGHLFCRECAVQNLLAQAAERKRGGKLAAARREEAAEREAREAEGRARGEVEAFERGEGAFGGGEAGRKRKAEAAVAEDAKRGYASSRQRREGSGAGAAAGGEELPSFWVPGETPVEPERGAEDEAAAAKRQQPICPAGSAKSPHAWSLKTLITVHFHEGSGNEKAASPDSETTTRTCPSCHKALTNATKAVLAKPCGHVLCRSCSDKFQGPVTTTMTATPAPTPATPTTTATTTTAATTKLPADTQMHCYVCQEDLHPAHADEGADDEGKKKKKRKKDSGDGEDGKSSGKSSSPPRGLVEISTDGTGFAGGGDNMVRKEGVAFQC